MTTTLRRVDPARAPDGGVRYRGPAPGICHSRSRRAESSSHCAAVRVGYARRAGDLDEQSCRARIARAGRIRRRRVHQNRSSGPRMAASWSRSRATRERRPHAEHSVPVAPGSRFAPGGVPHRARHGPFPDHRPRRRVRPQRTRRCLRHPRASWRLDRHRVDSRVNSSRRSRSSSATCTASARTEAFSKSIGSSSSGDSTITRLACRGIEISGTMARLRRSALIPEAGLGIHRHSRKISTTLPSETHATLTR